jgi:hypothetical protein
MTPFPVAAIPQARIIEFSEGTLLSECPVRVRHGKLNSHFKPQLFPRMDFELSKDAFKVFLDSSIGNGKPRGDLRSAEPPRDERAYFNLSPRKSREPL